MHRQLLSKSGLSVTQQRLAILDTLATIKGPATIEQIGDQVAISMNTSTLYRSLRALVDAGVVYQTDFRDGASYFELQDDHHHHVVCTSCGNHERIDICARGQFRKVEKATGYTITNHMLELFGLCKNCS